MAGGLSAAGPADLSQTVVPADLARVAGAVRDAQPDAGVEWPGGYPGQVELALIDAVLSIQARYGQPTNGVRGQVALWRRHRGSQADDLGALVQGDVGQVLTNRQRINGTLKVEVITQAAVALQERGITSATDVLSRSDVAQEAYCSVRGLSTVTFDYFRMLLGTETIKPDTWILRFLHQVLGRRVTPGEATALLIAAAREVGRPARQLDHQVWQYMRDPARRQGSATAGEAGVVDVAGLSVWQLLEARGQIDAELRRREVVRTGSSVAGELLERLVAKAYGGNLSVAGSKSVDVVLADGRRVQCKARWLDQGTSRVFAFSDFDVDVAVMALLDRNTYALVWAREVPVEELRRIARPYKGKWRIAMGAASRAGSDVTEHLAEAFRRL